MSNRHDAAIEAVKAAPPLGVAGLTIFGVSVADWAMLLTILYTLFLLIDKLPIVLERLRQFRRWLKEKTNGRVK